MNESKQEIRKLLSEGKTYIQIAREKGINRKTIERLFTPKEREEIKRAKITRSAEKKAERARKRVAEKRLTPKQEPVFSFKTLTVEKPKQPFKAEDAGVIDLWSYSPKKDGYNVFVSMDEKFGLRGIPTLNIPFFEYNPAKRLNQVARSSFIVDYDKIHKSFNGKGNFMELLNPDIPLVPKEDLPRHDIDTLNASIGFADNFNDFLQTQEDACVISAAFANRFTFRYVTPRVALFTTSDETIQSGKEVKAGDIIEKLEDENLTKLNQIKQDGTIFVKSKKLLVKGNKEGKSQNDLWLNRVTIETVRPLQVGDKLRSLSGMKVVISEIRENQIEDIIIHRNQIESKTGLKGAFVMELLKTGRVMVGMRRDEFIGLYENIAQGGSLSSTLYPILKLYAPEVLKEIVRDNSRFIELLESLHLKYNFQTGTFKLLPENLIGDIESYEKAGHRLWKKEDLTEGYFGKEEDFDIRDLTFRTTGGELTGGKWLVWENLFIPSFVSQGYFARSEWKNPPYSEFIDKTFEEKIVEFMNAKFPFIWKPRATESQKAKGETPMPEYTNIIKEILFTKIKNGLWLKVILSPETDVVTLSTKHKGFGKEIEGKEYVLAIREPCVGINNVYCLPVKYEDGLNPYVVRIPIDVVKAAKGDTDGDDWAILPYYSESLTLDNHNIEKQLPKQEYVTNIEYFKPYLNKRSIDTLITEALAERELNIEEQKMIPSLGGAKKRASFRCKSEEEQRAILAVPTIEEILKRERKTARVTVLKAIKELNAMGRKDVPDNENMNFLTAKTSMKGGGKKLGWERILGFRPAGFWFDLFGLPMNKEEETILEKEQEFWKGKKVILTK